MKNIKNFGEISKFQLIIIFCIFIFYSVNTYCDFLKITDESPKAEKKISEAELDRLKSSLKILPKCSATGLISANINELGIPKFYLNYFLMPNLIDTATPYSNDDLLFYGTGGDNLSFNKDVLTRGYTYREKFKFYNDELFLYSRTKK